MKLPLLLLFRHPPLLALGLCLLLPLRVLASDADERILKKIHEAVAELKTHPVILTDEDFDPPPETPPPAEVTEAGEEFVQAWRTWRRISSLKRKLVPLTDYSASGPAKNINTPAFLAEYQQMVEQLIAGSPAPAPTPDELGKFFFSDGGWCGTPTLQFADRNRPVILLACLRHQYYGDALDFFPCEYIFNSHYGEISDFRDFLSALGFDPEDSLLGAWLHENLEYSGRGYGFGRVCFSGSEKSARMVLQWANRHLLGDAPPEMSMLLDDGRGIAPETQAKIAKFIQSQTLPDNLANCLQKMSKDATVKLRPWLHELLRSSRNTIRKLAKKRLQEIGETDMGAEMIPPARYRILLNGVLWPDQMTPSFRSMMPNLVTESGRKSAAEAMLDFDGSFGGFWREHDYFFKPYPEITGKAHIVVRPKYSGFYTDTEQFKFRDLPWVKAPITLPPNFGEITDIQVKTVRVTFRLKRSKEVDAAATSPSSLPAGIYFGFPQGTDHSDRDVFFYPATPDEEVTLGFVQPGRYRWRARATGAALSPFREVKIGPEDTLLEQRLTRGATVTVPFALPSPLRLKDSSGGYPSLVHSIWESRYCISPEFYTLYRNGKAVTEKDLTDYQQIEYISPMKAGERNLTSNVMLRNLPEGRYRLAFRASDDLHLVPALESGWRAAEAVFEVNDRTPAELTLPLTQLPAP